MYVIQCRQGRGADIVAKTASFFWSCSGEVNLLCAVFACSHIHSFHLLFLNPDLQSVCDCMYLYVHANVCVSAGLLVFVCVHVCLCVCVYVCMRVYICVFPW